MSGIAAHAALAIDNAPLYASAAEVAHSLIQAFIIARPSSWMMR